MTGLILGFATRSREKIGRSIAWGGMAAGILLGFVVFGVRLYDPKGMNLPLTRFNRWVVVAVAVVAAAALLWALLSSLPRRVEGAWRTLGVVLLAALLGVAFMYLAPSVIQFTQEFVYFGESGFSTKALLRAIGFALGLALCLLLGLSSFKVHRALDERGGMVFLGASVLFFFVEYGFNAVASLQRLKMIPLSDLVFEIMVLGDEYENCFLFAQLLLGLVMLLWVIATHRRPEGEFANRALLRREKARLRTCRRWSWSLFSWALAAALTVTALHYYDTKPPAEVPPEAYDLSDGIISIDLEKVSDGHLHKFSYVTPNGYDVRFLVVKKPVGTAYGVGLDACEICGVAGYFERGDDVVCRRCDVVMNKNTIGFKGGCNPIPFPYEVREGRISIDVRELERHERRFR
ncbi:MAG: Fe-S-containing protein [Pyramidobacter sp.]|nr:Fe-S-containing protein [Pyramidobacter sp.]